MSEIINSPSIYTTEQVALTQLKPHPRNYRIHPDDEIDHIMESIRTHGFYRNIVTSKDGTILAGHGVMEAARRLGLKHIPIIRTNYAPDDPRALKLLVGDNEIQHLVETDDRVLTELLREFANEGDLLGTGYDDMMLATLAMVTRPASEIADLNAAAQWVGMPEYDVEGEKAVEFSVIINFAAEDDCKEFCHRLDLEARPILTAKVRKSIWWPKLRENMDSQSIRFVGKENGDD